MQRFILATALLLGMALGLVAVAPTMVSAADFNCGDFSSQSDAQQAYDYDTSDPYGLDGPVGPTSSGAPGVACEGGTGGTLTYAGFLAAIGAAPPIVEQPPVVEPPVEQPVEQPAPVTENTDATTVDSSVGATIDTATTGTTTVGTTSLPSTGVGSAASSSITMTSLLLALFAAAMLAMGTVGLIRARRG